MPPAAITVESLGKAYRIGLKDEVPDTLVGAATGWAKAPLRNFHNLRRLNTFAAKHDDQPDLIWALRDVSFEVPEGEVLGVIGRNGAGKSTLLKILSRITEPTTGRATIHGRVSSLLEVGTGFHQELSGRENIYMNGTILGMRKREIDRKLDQIIDFSGVEKFLDTPIKRYSSGMKVRLAFAVAAHLEPEILIIDEVLAVGDAEFQRKCLGKMHEVAQGGRTVLFVSHNMPAVRNLCTRAILLENGTKTFDATTDTVISAYLDGVSSTAHCRDFACLRNGETDAKPLHFEYAEICTTDGESSPHLRSNAGFMVRMQIRAHSPIKSTSIAIGLFTQDGLRVCGLNSNHTRNLTFDFESGNRYSAECLVMSANLAPGHYYLNLQLKDSHGNVHDSIESAVGFEVVADDVFGTGRIAAGRNLIVLQPEWTLSSR